MVFRSLPRAWMLLAALSLGVCAGPAFAVGVGDPAPAFSLSDLDSQSHSLSAYNSHPILLMFFDCGDASSISIAPLVQSAFYEGFAMRGLIVLGIECTGNDGAGRVILQRDGSTVSPPLAGGSDPRGV